MKMKQGQSPLKNGSKKTNARIPKANKQNWHICLFAILLVSLFAYLPVFQNGFVNWDDDQYIQGNRLIHSKNLKEIFSSYFMGNYHPFTLLILAFEFKIFGMNPAGYHIVNLLLHLMNIILVYYSVLLLSEKHLVALIASLIFALHPIHVESVAWVSELKDLLYSFFFLFSFIYYLKYIKTGKKLFYFLSLFLFLPALLSKAMAASLPLVLIIADYFKGRKINLKNTIEKIPFFVLALIFGLVAISAQKSSGSITDETAFTFSQQIIFACYGYVNYFIKMILPFNLSAFYPYPIKSGAELPSIYFIYPLLVLAFMIFIFYTLRFNKKIIFAIGFFTATILLVLQLIPVGGAIMADRYTYIPSIGLFYLAGEGIYLLWSKKYKFITITLVSVFTIFYSVKTYARCQVWKNGITLWTDVIEQYQNVTLAYNSRAVLFDSENKLDEAYSDYSKSIELNPNYDKAYNNRGNLLMKQNKFDQALVDYNKCIELVPNFSGAYKNRGNLYMNTNKPELAYQDYTKALQLDPKETEVYFYRGNLLQNLKRNDEALSDYANVIALKPNDYQVYFSRGLLFMNIEKNKEAYDDFSKAISLYPSFVEAYLNRGNVLQNENKFDEALSDYNAAAKLQPENPKIYYNRGNLLGNKKRYDEAINDFSTAIKLKNDYALAYFGRGISECNSGKKDAGCNDLQNAINLGFPPALDAFKNLCK